MAATPKLPADRFSAIFSALMVFCVLIWLWGLALFMLWPWHKGGEWLPDFPIVAVCADGQVCAVPFANLAGAQKTGQVSSLLPAEESGETSYEAITLRWKRQPSGMQVKASAWNFQTTVRYRIENDRPVLVEFQEIGGKVFLLAIVGALVTLAVLYHRKLKG